MSLAETEKAEAAAAVLGAFMDAPPESVEAPVEVSSPDDTAPEESAAPSPFAYEAEVPEDVLREIEEAEIDDAVERELAAFRPVADDAEPWEDHSQQVESEDDIRRRIQLEKRNEYLERELARTRGSSWSEEAVKYFPLSKHALATIGESATSRRAFLRAAKAEHERILPYVQEVLAETRTFSDSAKAQALADGKAAAAAAFGQPLSGPVVGVVDIAAANAELEGARAKARETGSLTGIFKALMQQGK